MAAILNVMRKVSQRRFNRKRRVGVRKDTTTRTAAIRAA
jgi:hypothetical protein